MTARCSPCKNRDGLSCQSCNELLEIETQIEDLRSRLKNLSERRLQALVGRNHIHSPLIHRFPLEIVTSIFMLVCPPFPCEHPTKQVSSPLILTQVCHSWRFLALSSPGLWNSISFNAHKPNFPRLDHQIAHSGVLPLSIHLYALSDDVSEAKKAMSFVMGQLHRTASLCLTLSGRLFDAVCDVDYPRAAPLLEKLNIHCMARDPYGLSRLRLATEPIRPRHLELGQLLHKQIHLDWTNVSSVTLRFCCMDEFLPEILAAKHLKQVVLRLSQDDLPRNITLVVHRSIEDLTLEMEYASMVLLVMTLPLLRKLRVYVDGMCNLRPICDFLHRSRCPLQVLDVHIGYQLCKLEHSTQAVMEVLENTSMLQQLSLRFSTIQGPQPSGFELLIRRLSSQDVWFLPCLQTFSLQTDFVPPIHLLLETLATDDKVHNGANTVRPLHNLVLKLWMPFAGVGPIPRDDIRRILQLRAAGQTISVTSSFHHEEVDLVEYWQNVYGIGEE